MCRGVGWGGGYGVGGGGGDGGGVEGGVGGTILIYPYCNSLYTKCLSND